MREQGSEVVKGVIQDAYTNYLQTAGRRETRAMDRGQKECKDAKDTIENNSIKNTEKRREFCFAAWWPL